jgi:thiosulfate reductase cytochrome b subunit
MFYHYPVYIRIWHLINALMFLVLILTGFSMQFSGSPDPCIPFRTAVRWHNTTGIIVSVNYLLFLIGNIISGNGKNYRSHFKGLFRQCRYYILGYFKKEAIPYPIAEERKFNPFQAFSYAMTMYIGMPVIIITGWGLIFPETLIETVFGVNGLVVTDVIHIIAGVLLSLFMFLHIYISSIGTSPKGNFRAIITGWINLDKD